MHPTPWGFYGFKRYSSVYWYWLSLEPGSIEKIPFGGWNVYIERHGLHGLATALEYAFEYGEETVNPRITARELDLSPLEAELILQALEPVATGYDAVSTGEVCRVTSIDPFQRQVTELTADRDPHRN